MPASSDVTIANQVVTDLNAQFSASFTAVRVYDPVPYLVDAGTLKALVIALDEDSTRTSRASFSRDLTISVGFVSRLAQTTDASNSTKVTEIDNLNGVVESVADWFRAQRTYSTTSHILLEVKRQQPQQVYPDGLRMGVYFSAVNLTFRKF